VGAGARCGCGDAARGRAGSLRSLAGARRQRTAPDPGWVGVGGPAAADPAAGVVAGGLFTVSIPEGWARSSDGPAAVFTDKLNSVRIEAAPRPAPPTPDSARAQDLPALAASLPGFAPGQVSTVTRRAGPGCW
jgi:hypothetical protein